VRKRRQFIIALFILAVLVFLARGPLGGVLGGGLHIIGRPFWSAKTSITEHTGGLFALFRSKAALAEKNKELEAALDLVAAEAYSREHLRAENEALKTALGRDPESQLGLARVLASPGVSSYDTLVIDAGEEHGISEGMDVFVDGDFTIGTITRVFRRSAVVTLFSSPGAELEVNIGTSSIPTVAHGAGGGNFRVTLPEGAHIVVGDIVEIPALSPEYIGVVDAIDRPQGSSLQTIFVKLPFNLFTLKWVYVAYPKP
jgi:cell shape-determining protein MreC